MPHWAGMQFGSQRYTYFNAVSGDCKSSITLDASLRIALTVAHSSPHRRTILSVMIMRSGLLPFALAIIMMSATSSGQQSLQQAAVEMRYCGFKPGRPPLLYLSFNITLRNPGDKPQWFLFPASLYDKPQTARPDAGIDSIELLSDFPEHKVTVVDFMGTMKLQPDGAGGFKGVLLPPAASVSIQGFGISFWGEPASPISIHVVIADHITIGGLPVEQWMGETLTSAKSADVKNLERAGSKSSPDLGELPVVISKSGELTIADALAQKCSPENQGH